MPHPKNLASRIYGLSVSLLVLFPGACATHTGPDMDSTIETYWVNSYRVPCEGVAPMTCLQVHTGEQPFGEWKNFYSPIEGFDYQPGSLYRVRVRQTRLPADSVPADASSIRYELLETLDVLEDPRFGLNDIFVLLEVAGTPLSRYEPASRREAPTIEFHIARNDYAGFDGCNRFSGRLAHVDGRLLELGPAMSTEMACGDGALQAALHAALVRVRSWRRSGLRLELLDRSGNAILEYSKVD